jgi:hypothetical protein
MPITAPAMTAAVTPTAIHNPFRFALLAISLLAALTVVLPDNDSKSNAKSPAD